jgi:hypothetical protein
MSDETRNVMAELEGRIRGGRLASIDHTRQGITWLLGIAGRRSIDYNAPVDFC